MIRLSTTSIVAMLSVSEASAIGITAPSARPARSSGRLVRRVAEDEGEGDREGDGRQVREAGRGADRHPGDLADRAAGQAVQGRGDRDAGQRAPLGRHRVVMVVGVGSCLHGMALSLPPWVLHGQRPRTRRLGERPSGDPPPLAGSAPACRPRRAGSRRRSPSARRRRRPDGARSGLWRSSSARAAVEPAVALVAPVPPRVPGVGGPVRACRRRRSARIRACRDETESGVAA